MKLPDLRDVEAAGVRERHGDVAPLAAAARDARLRFHAADLKGVGSKAELMAALQRGLALPEHFGSNWDALADCLEDGDWLGHDGCVVALTHAGAFRKAHAADWSTLDEILNEAADFWRERHKPFWVFVG
jgi:RNAse (barnase) inhibitor barstar